MSQPESLTQSFGNFRRSLYAQDQSLNEQGRPCSRRKEIPEEDLIILEKIYHKSYSDCGRKRGALLRYIAEYKKQEPSSFRKSKLFNWAKRQHI